MKRLPNILKFGVLSSVLVLLSACSDSDNDLPTPPEPPTPEPVIYSYQVTVTNLTYGQPMSPVAVVLHDEGNLFNLGESASEAIEMMAEGGDNSGLLETSVALVSATSDGILMPGASTTIELTIQDTMPVQLSLATMLVNTNDAFTGVNGQSIANLALDESISLLTSSYDAGTEANSEMMGTIPGPADGGEGFNAERDDILDVVTMHSGVVSVDDGLSSSVLTEAHKFDNPTMRVVITRSQ
ncbi:spondin domain-containing protein [Thalassotalea sp. LPB0316]|uniref:spondin domain-containing protein n=1 Tax=Thalassotalea sp. LPB0316 TaxID=2769490 RepID=UPI001865B332|nr:spondin domain-containing protein [Thalassotalea sp. LPB0316]QOL25254.1 spondin domain-containing protein [Thalassotalea sp. LPB0316]